MAPISPINLLNSVSKLDHSLLPNSTYKPYSSASWYHYI
jgi:hypothetical protein